MMRLVLCMCLAATVLLMPLGSSNVDALGPSCRHESPQIPVCQPPFVSIAPCCVPSPLFPPPPPKVASIILPPAVPLCPAPVCAPPVFPWAIRKVPPPGFRPY